MPKPQVPEVEKPDSEDFPQPDYDYEERRNPDRPDDEPRAPDVLPNEGTHGPGPGWND